VPLLAIRVATEAGRALPRLAVCAGLGAVLATLTAGAPPDPVALLLAVPAVLLAITANLVAMHAFAAAAFWIRDTRSTWFLYQKFVFVLGGMLLPLEVLPGPLTATAKALPFMAMAYAPARLVSGHREPHLLAVQALWLVVLCLLTARVYGAGERRLQLAGA
jgi:ABC-2 type transport system permease protein